MKIKFKRQSYQTNAVEAVADCFLGQLQSTGIQYRIDPGVQKSVPQQSFKDFDEIAGFRNRDLTLNPAQILQHIQVVQRRQSLTESSSLVESNVCKVNLDIEMETGTGKTYCYIKSMFELHKRFGWSKFIVVVPSIAIREGVKKSFEMTGEHFLEDYGKRARFFIYDSKQLHNLESFSSDGGINVMIINVQAFNAKLEDRHEAEIFTRDKTKKDFGKATKVDRHIYDYVFTDSNTERTFVRELDTSAEVVVYAKLPKSFFIPTPVGNYNPDWAIAFEEGKVKHIYFIAETKGSMSSMELRKIEECKIDCARKFFSKITADRKSPLDRLRRPHMGQGQSMQRMWWICFA